jgi:hypothetical protein
MTDMKLEKIQYKNLNSRQKEAFNFQKVSAVLANYGYSTMRLLDDWQGADFIAQHCNGLDFVKVQLKSRMTIDRKYLGKQLMIVFPDGDSWYVYDHDAVVAAIEQSIETTTSWKDAGSYSWPALPEKLRGLTAIKRL